MMLTATEQARLVMVRADVVARIVRTMDRFERETGQKSYIISGWRSLSQQSRTYADSLRQGFQAAKPETSRHPLGAAVDIGIVGHVRNDAAKDQADPLYAVLARIGTEEGLSAGYYWKGTKPDPYHFEAKESLADSRAKWAVLTKERQRRAAGAGAVVGGALIALALARSARG